MPSFRRWGWGVAALLPVAACARAPGSDEEHQQRLDEETALARHAIEITNQRYMMHFNAGKGDSVAVLFAEQGRAMWPNAPAAVGREAIARGFSSMAPMTPNLRLRTEEVAASGPVAVERGRYTITWTPPGGSQLADSGKYVMRWQKLDGQWLIIDNIWNSDLPSAR